ncbi:amino acid adenylation domain-containing protein [Streptomyces sp. NPDC018321]|uniref:amino acid adenylation domain-containing protein n=1 Tax=unclassified Streptomyces TaxID=2593676 RepID=UPI0037B24927
MDLLDKTAPPVDRAVQLAPTFVDVVTERAALSDGTAYTFVSPDRAERPSLTFPALDARARSVGAMLAERGLAGERVLVLLPPGLDYVAAFLGCLYAGAVAVPLYPPSGGKYSARHLAVLADSAPAAALVPGADLGRGAELAAELGAPGLVLLSVDGELPDPDGWRRPDVDGDGVAFLQYTSGSTGTPRGVRVTHRNLVVNSAQIQERFGSGPDTGVVSWLPPYHDMGLIGGILQPVYAGAPATLLSPTAFITRPLLWLELMSEQGAVISGGPNFAYDLCVDRIPAERLAGLDLSRWRVAFNGAEPVRASTLERFAERMAPSGFRREAFFPCYGLAEATLMVSGRRVGGEEVARTFDADSLGPGRRPEPAPGGLPVVDCGPVAEALDVVVADAERGAACAPGTVGEIWVSGENVADGYWGRPVPDGTFGAVLPGDTRSYLRTGDYGFLSEGRLYVTGRSKDLIVVRGRNHYPQDLETTALAAHATLRRGAAAFAVERNGREEVCLVLETAHGHVTEQAEEVVGAVRAALVRDHGVTPGSVVLVRPGVIPRTTSGKIQRSAARAALAEGAMKVVHRSDTAPATATEPSSAPSSSAPSAPVADATTDPAGGDDLRAVVARLAGRRLGVRVDPAAPLVAQGLDSLAAVELQAAVAEATGVELSLEELLAGACVDALTLTAPAAPVRAPGATGDAGDAGATGSTGDTAPPAPDGRLPLTPSQQSMVFLEQQHPGTSALHISVAVRLLSPVAPDALGRAFQQLVDRYPALRTALRWADGEPYQTVLPSRTADFTVEDARAWDDDTLAARLERSAESPFALDEGHVLRALLLRRTDGDVLSLTLHHVAADMWSMALLTEELARLLAHEAGRGPALPEPPEAAHPASADRRRRLLESPRGERLREYWDTALAGCEPVLELPADRPRPPVQSLCGDTVTFTLDPAVTRELRRRAEAEDTTLFVTLLSVFQVLLHRFTGQDDFLVGVPGSGRHDAALQRVIGYFVNPLLVRATVTEEATFAQRVRETRQAVVGALAHQEMPFPELVRRLGLQRDASRSPGYQVMFSLTNAHLSGLEGLGALQTGRGGIRTRLGGLDVESVAVARHSAQTDLGMTLGETDGALEGVITYCTDLFDRQTVERFAAHFGALAAQVAAAPDEPLRLLPNASAAEERDVASWNETATGYPRESTLTELFAEHVRRTPDAPALVYGEHRSTYRELDRRANALAARLRDLGVGPETLVGLHVDRDPSVVVAMLAVVKAGGAYLPLDPGHPARRLRQILDEARPAVLLTPSGDRPTGVEWDAPVVSVDAFMGPEVARDPAHDAAVDPGTGPGSLLYVMYTSGSSGRPKGICITHRNVIRLVRDTNFVRIEPGDRMAQISNAAWDAATLEIWGAVLNGAVLHGFDQATVLNPPRLGEALREARADTVVFATPLFTEVAAYDPTVFAGARELVVGGDTMDPKRAREVVDLGGPLLINDFGPTESTSIAATFEVREVPEGTWRVPIGRPIANTRVYVLDAWLRPVPVGVPGQLFIGGDGLGRGYLGRPAQTAGVFLPDPFGDEPGARMYATGDQVRWLPGGTLDFLGRIDFQVKIRGYRIELGDIDSAVLAHPGVRESLTVVDESAGHKRLVGYYAGTPSPRELAGYLTDWLPRYMIPPVLLRLPELPKNPNRKIDRAALPEPPAGAAAWAAGATDGLTPLEREITTLLAEVLGVPDVAADDDFFDIGGHSLLAIRLTARLRERHGVEIDLNAFFHEPTARGAARCVQELLDAGQTVAAPAAPTGPVALPRARYARSAPGA